MTRLAFFHSNGKKTCIAEAFKASVLDKLEELDLKMKSVPKRLMEYLVDITNVYRKIVFTAYGKRSDDFSSLNDVRVHLFHKKNSLNCLPPTENSFKYHVKCAVFQRFLMLQAAEAQPVIHNPYDYGHSAIQMALFL